jgi:hypothetical protein
LVRIPYDGSCADDNNNNNNNNNNDNNNNSCCASQNQQRSILTDLAIRNSNNLHSTNTEELQEYADIKERLIRIWQLKAVYVIPLVLSTTGISQNKLHGSLKLPDLRSALYVLMQKTRVLHMCRIVRKFLAEQPVGSAFFREPAKLV